MGTLSRRALAVGAAAVAAAALSVLAAAPEDEAPAGESSTRRVRISYTARMDVPFGAAEAVLYLPVPRSSEHQAIHELRAGPGGQYKFLPDDAFGNRVMRVEKTTTTPGPLMAFISAVITREGYRVPIGEGEPDPVEAEDEEDDPVRDRTARRDRAVRRDAVVLESFLQPNAMIPLQGRVSAEAEKVVTGEMTDAQKARAMYDHLAATLSYDKSVPGYGRGDAVRACDVRKGNCTDFHSLFIGMARAEQIPARFLMGFTLPADRDSGKVPGYHCWAEFYLPEAGWVPVDVSEASQAPERHEELFGGLDAHRVHFTTGRDLTLEPGSGLPLLNYFIYPVGVIDGELIENVFWELKFEDVEED